MENNTNIFDQFGLPEGYFDKSKSSIQNKIEWQTEHEAYPTLLSLKNGSGFIVPNDYFVTNESKLELLAYECLSEISKQNAFVAPIGYFGSTKNAILSKINQENELVEMPILSSVNKQLPFITKDQYFADTKTEILNKGGENKGAKVISLNRKPLWIAAAAVLTMSFSLWIYNAYFNQTEVIDGDCNTLACIEKRELLKFKLDNLDNDELYELVNSKKLEERLNKKEKTDSLKTSDSIDASVLDYIE